MDEKLRQPHQGHLVKFTNVVKGWQTRWFILNPELGTLHYYLSEHDLPSRPRGSIQLAGAVISPSDEDCQTFTVSPACGEAYKLRAQDTKDRQMWLNRLRVIAEMHTRAIAHHHAAFPSRDRRGGGSSASLPGASSAKPGQLSQPGAPHYNSATHVSLGAGTQVAPVGGSDTANYSSGGLAVLDAFTQASELLQSAHRQHASLAASIEDLPAYGGGLKCSEPQLLLLKATSQATVLCLDSCLSVLQQQQQLHQQHRPKQGSPSLRSSPPTRRAPHSPTPTHRPASTFYTDLPHTPLAQTTSLTAPPAASPSLLKTAQQQHASYDETQRPLEGSMASKPLERGSDDSVSGVAESCGSTQRQEGLSWGAEERPLATGASSGLPTIPPHVLHSNALVAGSSGSDSEESDSEDALSPSDSRSDADGVKKNHSVVMHLLSQMKLGMDLTKVTLPTFVLERRSLLEMFADFVGHPELFLSIAEASSSEARMAAVVRWYLTSVRFSRCGVNPKKPYNPVIGETFQCGWRVPRASLDQRGSSARPSSSGKWKSDYISVRFCAEQVSHHPPVSAFFFECPEKQLCINGHIYTKSKFMGTFIEVSFLGDITLSVGGLPPETRGDRPREATDNSKGNREGVSSSDVEGKSAADDDWVTIDSEPGRQENVQLRRETRTSSLEKPSEVGGSNATLNKESSAGQSQTYTLSMPSAFARSILTEPWSELGGRVSLSCVESGCVAPLVFHTKPFYGSNLHRVSGEVRGGAGETLCKIAGEWDKSITLTYPKSSEHLAAASSQLTKDADGNTVEVLDVSNMAPVPRKRVRPLRSQGEGESRRLWQDVSSALARRDLETATAHKQHLETLQRNYETKRMARMEPYIGKLFRRVPRKQKTCDLTRSPAVDEKSSDADSRRGSDDNSVGGSGVLTGTEHWVYKKLPSYAPEDCGAR